MSFLHFPVKIESLENRNHALVYLGCSSTRHDSHQSTGCLFKQRETIRRSADCGQSLKYREMQSTCTCMSPRRTGTALPVLLTLLLKGHHHASRAEPEVPIRWKGHSNPVHANLPGTLESSLFVPVACSLCGEEGDGRRCCLAEGNRSGNFE